MIDRSGRLRSPIVENALWRRSGFSFIGAIALAATFGLGLYAQQDESDQEAEAPATSAEVATLAWDDSLFDNLAWREIGPNFTGGRIVDIDVDPDNNDVIYAASASGGLWKTENRGTTWSCIFENENTMSIGDIAVDQNDGKVIWVGTGEANNQRSSMWGDGIYKSNDGGETWEHKGLVETHHIGRIVIDPNDSNVAYVAALGHLYTHNEERGLFKTTDGGETWDKVLYVNPEVGVTDVVLDPTNSQIIYAATYERLRRAWHFDGAGPGSAIYKSSDGGASWTRLEGGLPSGEIGRIGIDISRKNPQLIYATVSNQNLQPVTERSTEVQVNDDGQVTTPFGVNLEQEDGRWVVKASGGRDGRRGGRARGGRFGTQAATLRPGDVVIAIGGTEIEDETALIEILKSIKPTDAVQFKIERDGTQQMITVTIPRSRPSQIGGEIYRTEDGGETWEKVNERPVGGSPAYYYGQIRVDPQDDERIYILSVPAYVSSNGGKTFQTIAGSVHVDHHALWIDPENSNRLILGNDGGFHFSYDRGKTWDWVYNLPLCQFYAITVDMQTPYHVYGGLQDNGSIGGPGRTRSTRGVTRLDWYRIGGGDGFYVQVDPDDADIIFSESQFGAINRLDRASGRAVGIRPPRVPGAENPDRYNWNSPILMSKYDSRMIFFGANRLYRSYNRGDDWIAISPDLTTQNSDRIAGNVPHCTITTIDQSPHNRRHLLVGTDDGKVQVTFDDGQNWQDLSSHFPLRPENWWCSRVTFCRHDEGTMYVSFTGYREDDFRPFVFRSRDRGQTFESIAANLPDEPINVIQSDPKNEDVVYVGTDFGVFVSIDGCQQWYPLREKLPRAPVHDLIVHPRDNDLVIGTHGRGIYILDDISVLQQIDRESSDESAVLYQPRNEIMWGRGRGGGISGDRKVDFPNPDTGFQIYYYLANEVDEDADFSISVKNEQGENVNSRLRPSRSAGLNRVVWNFARSGGNRGFFRGQGRAGQGGGPAIRPGKYTITLSLGETELTKTVELLADPGAN